MISTVIVLALQLYYFYESELRNLAAEFSAIEQEHLPALTQSVWSTHQNEARLQLEAMIGAPHLTHAVIEDGNRVFVEVGTPVHEQPIRQSYPLSFTQLGREYDLGVLTVTADKQRLVLAAFNHGIRILVPVTIILLSFIIAAYVIVNRLVTRHLVRSADYVATLSPANPTPPLVLDKKRGDAPDELDQLTAAINKMQVSAHSLLAGLEQSEAQFRAIADYTCDWESWLTPDGRLHWVNPAVERVTGYSVAECLDMRDYPLPIVAMDDRQGLVALFQRMVKERTVGNEVPFRIRCKGGEIRWVEMNWQPIYDGARQYLGIRTSIRDISQRKEAEFLVEQQRLEQQQILDSMIDAVITFDAKGTILSFNLAAEAMFSFEQKEILGENIGKIIPSIADSLRVHRNAGHEPMRPILKTGFSREVTGLRKNQERFPMRLSMAQLPDVRAADIRYVGSCHDMTIERQQEDKIRRAQKMDALGKLTGGIAHDFNNMLGVILGYAQLLQAMPYPNEKAGRYIGEIHAAGERAQKLTSKLLAFSRQKATAPQPTRLDKLLWEQRDMLAKTLTARINLVYEVTEGVPLILVDKAGLVDSILNISINAMHAMPDGGTFIVRCDKQRIHSESGVNECAEEQVMLSFVDTGHGMGQETKEKLFDPFFTTKGEQGTGLGMSQVYGLVKQSNAQIKVYSEPGEGTEIRILFPQYSEVEPGQEEERTPDEQKQWRGNGTVLVVDDEPSLVQLNRTILEQCGYRVFIAGGGEEALALLAREAVDVVLSDVIMPDMSGYALARRIRTAYPHIKLQLVSGFSDNEHVQSADTDLRDNLLAKPFTAAELVSRIRGLLEEQPPRRHDVA